MGEPMTEHKPQPQAASRVCLHLLRSEQESVHTRVCRRRCSKAGRLRAIVGPPLSHQPKHLLWPKLWAKPGTFRLYLTTWWVQVMELVAEEDAPKLDYLELLQGHPSDISQADKAAAAEAREQAAAAAEAARSEVACSHIFTG